MENKELWTIRITEERDVKVLFPREVTREEAMTLFERSEYADILDEDVVELIDVLDAR